MDIRPATGKDMRVNAHTESRAHCFTCTTGFRVKIVFAAGNPATHSLLEQCADEPSSAAVVTPYVMVNDHVDAKTRGASALLPHP